MSTIFGKGDNPDPRELELDVERDAAEQDVARENGKELAVERTSPTAPLTDAQRAAIAAQRAGAAAEQDVAELERIDRDREASAGAPITDDALDQALIATGYVAARGAILGVAGQAATLDLAVIDACIRQIVMDLPKLRARADVGQDAIGGLTNELEAMRAVKRLRQELGDLNARAATRSRILGTNGTPVR